MWAVNVVATLDVIGLATLYRPARLGILSAFGMFRASGADSVNLSDLRG